MSLDPRLLAVSRGRQLITEHGERAGIEGDSETILWHMLADVIEFCDEEGINLDATLNSVQQHFAEQKPAPTYVQQRRDGQYEYGRIVIEDHRDRTKDRFSPIGTACDWETAERRRKEVLAGTWPPRQSVEN